MQCDLYYSYFRHRGQKLLDVYIGKIQSNLVNVKSYGLNVLFRSNYREVNIKYITLKMIILIIFFYQAYVLGA